MSPFGVARFFGDCVIGMFVVFIGAAFVVCEGAASTTGRLYQRISGVNKKEEETDKEMCKLVALCKNYVSRPSEEKLSSIRESYFSQLNASDWVNDAHLSGDEEMEHFHKLIKTVVHPHCASCIRCRIESCYMASELTLVRKEVRSHKEEIGDLINRLEKVERKRSENFALRQLKLSNLSSLKARLFENTASWPANFSAPKVFAALAGDNEQKPTKSELRKLKDLGALKDVHRDRLTQLRKTFERNGVDLRRCVKLLDDQDQIEPFDVNLYATRSLPSDDATSNSESEQSCDASLLRFRTLIGDGDVREEDVCALIDMSNIFRKL